MALSAFADKSLPPTPSDLEAVLGKAYPHWQALQAQVAATFAPITTTWGFAGKAYGWGQKLAQKKRAVLYMTPCAGHFLASFALGERAVAAAKASKTPAWILEAIAAAPKYAEGRGVRLPVRTAKAVREVLALAVLKMAT